MPSPAVILGILLVVALAALTASGALLKASWKDVAELEAKYAQQQAEIQGHQADQRSQAGASATNPRDGQPAKGPQP